MLTPLSDTGWPFTPTPLSDTGWPFTLTPSQNRLAAQAHAPVQYKLILYMSVAFSVMSDDLDIDGGVVTNGAPGATEAPGDSPAATLLGAELGFSPPRNLQPKRALLFCHTEHHLPRPARPGPSSAGPPGPAPFWATPAQRHLLV